MSFCWADSIRRTTNGCQQIATRHHTAMKRPSHPGGHRLHLPTRLAQRCLVVVPIFYRHGRELDKQYSWDSKAEKARIMNLDDPVRCELRTNCR